MLRKKGRQERRNGEKTRLEMYLNPETETEKKKDSIRITHSRRVAKNHLNGLSGTSSM